MTHLTWAKAQKTIYSKIHKRPITYEKRLNINGHQEMQMKIKNKRYHFILTRITIITAMWCDQKTENLKSFSK